MNNDSLEDNGYLYLNIAGYLISVMLSPILFPVFKLVEKIK